MVRGSHDSDSSVHVVPRRVAPSKGAGRPTPRRASLRREQFVAQGETRVEAVLVSECQRDLSAQPLASDIKPAREAKRESDSDSDAAIVQPTAQSERIIY